MIYLLKDGQRQPILLGKLLHGPSLVHDVSPEPALLLWHMMPDILFSNMST
jgi:hypothetical protein